MDLSFRNDALQINYELKGLGSVNVILGKNGCGKSSLLRALNQTRRNKPYVKYIPPERGGVLTRDGGFETNMQNADWLHEMRARKNRFDQFRQNSVAEFRVLETLVLREIEKNVEKRKDVSYTFDTVVAQLNSLLENVELVRSPDGGFAVQNRGEMKAREAETLSSGEVELISLGIEILSFAFSVTDQKFAAGDNWLLFDEPDVHLHPDLQHRLMKMLCLAMKDKPFKVLISTHSTAVVSALADAAEVKVAFMSHRQHDLTFESVSPALRAVMPIFGAHPLSNVFNSRPILLVEGEDDERIWQQAVRSSGGGVNVWPCVAGDIQSLHAYEQKAVEILNSVYENARAYSLRDRDDEVYDIGDVGPLVRARLNCRAAENLMLTDDALKLLGITWGLMQEKLKSWIEKNQDHSQYRSVLAFCDGGFDRRDSDIKSLRNLLLGVVGSSKPWEVLVGQAIANLKKEMVPGTGSLTDFLGPKIVSALKLHP